MIRENRLKKLLHPPKLSQSVFSRVPPLQKTRGAEARVRSMNIVVVLQLTLTRCYLNNKENIVHFVPIILECGLFSKSPPGLL